MPATKHPTIRNRPWLAGAIAAAALLLGGCANLADVPPGTSLSDVQAQYGNPDFTCTTTEGSQRVIWTMQPMGQHAWGSNVDASGNIEGIEPILTSKNFRKLEQGTWTRDQVECEYGPPAEISPVGLPASRQIVWSYRFKENGAWNSLMHIYFDPGSDKVMRHHPGPDPMFERERFVFW
ncbi:MAG TPA: hypothetical protein VK104_03380 [Burkholderiaceae bacterium]|nr:hypothetical protein [Burkholderiaceae bacterium]